MQFLHWLNLNARSLRTWGKNKDKNMIQNTFCNIMNIWNMLFGIFSIQLIFEFNVPKVALSYLLLYYTIIFIQWLEQNSTLEIIALLQSREWYFLSSAVISHFVFYFELLHILLYPWPFCSVLHTYNCVSSLLNL